MQTRKMPVVVQALGAIKNSWMEGQGADTAAVATRILGRPDDVDLYGRRLTA